MKYLKIILLLLFYVPAWLFAFIAGMIGGRDWRVTLSLRQHLDGESMNETSIKIVHKD